MGNAMFVRGGRQFHGCMSRLHNKKLVNSAIQHTVYTQLTVTLIQHSTLLSLTIDIHNIQHMKRLSCEDCMFCDSQINERRRLWESHMVCICNAIATALYIMN